MENMEYLRRIMRSKQIFHEMYIDRRYSYHKMLLMNGTLTVNVILAKDIHILQSDILKSLILGRPVERKDQIVSPSSYVVVKVVPTPKSSKFQSFRTKVQNKTSNPVYDSTFEFNLGCTGLNSREGFLVHSIFNKDCCSIDRLIGEALLPLCEIPCLPSPKPNNYPKSKGESSSKNCDHPVLNNVFLNLTYPRNLKNIKHYKC
ncbi:hypothetical protein Avbf_09462 [Armadillidium vulgare]|nr:hypothetical protein Avbf_09462 [Armadillidium vulgare]